MEPSVFRNIFRGGPNFPQLMPYKIALIGDSQTAIGANTIGTITSITQVDGVATITTSAAHSIQAGDLVSIKCTGVGSGAYKGVKTIISTPSTTTATYQIDSGAPATATGVIEGWHSLSKYWRTPFNVANSILGNRFSLVVNAGIGSDTSAHVLARIPTDIFPFSPDLCIIFIGINDITSGVTYTVILNNIASSADILKQNGIIPAISTLPPLTSASGLANATTRKAIADLNNEIRNLCASNGYVLLDTFAAIVDPTSAVNDAISEALQSDGLHFLYDGARRAGEAWAEVLKYICPSSIDTLPKSVGDVWAYGNNIFSDPLIATITGGTTDVFTGTLPADWRIQRTGGMTGTVSVVNRTIVDDGDIYGKNLVVSATPTAINEQLNINNNTQANAAFATSGPGYYVFEGHLQVRNCVVAPTIIGAHVQFSTGGRTIYFYAGGTNGAAALDSSGTISLKFKSSPFLIPTGATSLRPFVSVYAGSADPFQLCLGRVALRKVSSI